MITDRDFKELLRTSRELRKEVQELKQLLLPSHQRDKDEYLNFEEAKKYLKVGRTKMFELLSEGELPFATKVGNRWRFSQKELSRYVSKSY
jgi:excisionase family DNA binding protein